MMRRAALLLALASCADPDVLLAGKPFPVTSAAALPLEYETVLGLHRATVVVFGTTQNGSMCDAVTLERNYCNLRSFPDATLLGVWPFARPLAATGPTGLLLVPDTEVGRASSLPRVEDRTNYGLTLTSADAARVRSTSHEVWLERIAPGKSMDVSFNAQLADGREFRGDVSAEWCSGLLLGTRNELQDRYHAGGVGHGTASGKGYTWEFGCSDSSKITVTCEPNTDETKFDCDCQRPASTFELEGSARWTYSGTLQDALELCPLRFFSNAPL
ncbi:MAG: hypothetical protein QM817_37755 [Archangium sp.]